ncbi:LLM class flavin-dependent oxidoreductase [Ilumatobacter sp.]|uniref:LLM class flavin-dependent oxidoreductase n=1 Tax=Ilumatobacter sp. TaxID=1967498 RepID=UPI003C530EDA
MLIDLAIHPFDADVASMVALAAAAGEAGYNGVWLTDHFSGAVVGRRWSRDPFVCLGAMAGATEHLELGVLVANMHNRHPAQVASAVNSLQSLAPGRVRLGIGSGAVEGSRFAVEHEAIGTDLGNADGRRAMLAESIQALRAIWAGETTFDARTGVGFDGLDGIVDDSPCPPIIVGASAWPTIEVALAHADGVNVRRSDRSDGLVRRIVELRPPSFEVSLLDSFDDVASDPSRADAAVELGVDRLVLGISVPHHVRRLRSLDVTATTHLDAQQR